MITTRKFLGVAAAVTIGALLACANDSTAPAFPDRVFTSLEMSESAFTLTPIETFNEQLLWVRAKDQYGVDMDVRAKSFSSSDPGVATVTGTGRVTAVAPGEAVISASVTIAGLTKTATSTVTVEWGRWSLRVDPAALTLHIGSSGHTLAKMVGGPGEDRLIWARVSFTSNSDVVTLHAIHDLSCWAFPCESEVRLVGVAPGEATITAEYGGLSATATVTVVP